MTGRYKFHHLGSCRVICSATFCSVFCFIGAFQFYVVQNQQFCKQMRCSARRSPKMGHLARACKLIHTQRILDWNFAKIQRTPVCTLLISFDRRLMQNIKTSVPEEFNILQTDVFKFCNMSLWNKIKRVQTNKGFTVEILQGCTGCLFCNILGDLRAEHLKCLSVNLVF